MIEFDSFNPYSNMEVIVADDPVSLLAIIKSIRTPIKIVAIVAFGTKQAAYIMGNVKVIQTKSKIKGAK